MRLLIVNEQERHTLQALLAKGAMTPEQLTELCKNAFGWSTSVIRRTQKALLAQGLVQERDGLLTPTVTMEDLENTLWDSRLQGTFEWQPPAQPKSAAKQPFFKSVWFWTTCAACVVIAVLCALLIFPPAPATDNSVSFPKELQVCKDALAKWQAHDVYYMEHATQYQTDPPVDNEPLIYNWYYVHEEDWMWLSADWNNPEFDSYYSYMYRDGELYCTRNLKNKYWAPMLHLSTTTPPDEYTPNPWPMTFNWENCELIYRNTSKYNYGSIIRFTIIDRSGEAPEVYEAEFALDNFKDLYYIQIMTIKDGKKFRLETYTMKNNDPDMIAEAIANQGNDAPLDNSEPVSEPG